MGTTVLTAKKAAREHRNIVHSDFFSFQRAGQERTSNFSTAAVRANEELFLSQRKATEYALANLLPIEEEQREWLEQRLDAIDQLFAALKPRKHRYPILSPEPLKWRDKDGFPKLVIMPLDVKGYVEIKSGHSSSGKYYQYSPLSGNAEYAAIKAKIVSPCYEDVFQKLDPQTRYEENFIRMELGALLIPTSTRKKIAKARQFFGKQIFLIAEANEWVLGKVTLPKPDPLIVGYEDGLLFLIDVFDLKPIEDIARSEFAAPQL